MESPAVWLRKPLRPHVQNHGNRRGLDRLSVAVNSLVTNARTGLPQPSPHRMASVRVSAFRWGRDDSLLLRQQMQGADCDQFRRENRLKVVRQ
jgi:hypothetical protein